MKHLIHTIAIIITVLVVTVHAAEESSVDFVVLYQEGKYEKALETINARLKSIYYTRVDDKRIPSEYISLKEDESKAQGKINILMKMFRERKAESFLIEENPELVMLHHYAGRSYFQLSQYENSLRHYQQCLRFKSVQYNNDDILWHEIAQIFKKRGYMHAYYEALECAYSLNTEKSEYSLELGIALSHTNNKKKAIFHLEQYLKSSPTDIQPPVYLILANLNEDIAKYLETEKYYLKYLNIKPDDGLIQFALGYTTFAHTGNHQLASQSLQKALTLVPPANILVLSRTNHYLGDISFMRMSYKEAISYYKQTIQYQDSIRNIADSKKNQIKELNTRINALKTSLLMQQDFQKYSEYQQLLKERSKLEMEMKKIENDYKIINSGKVHWFIAESYEKMDQFNEAINHYEQAISMNYLSNDARDKIAKLQLKIKRGF